jgi:hypothetical protein
VGSGELATCSGARRWHLGREVSPMPRRGNLLGTIDGKRCFARAAPMHGPCRPSGYGHCLDCQSTAPPSGHCGGFTLRRGTRTVFSRSEPRMQSVTQAQRGPRAIVGWLAAAIAAASSCSSPTSPDVTLTPSMERLLLGDVQSLIAHSVEEASRSRPAPSPSRRRRLEPRRS